MQNKVLIVRASGLVGTAAAISFARADWPIAVRTNDTYGVIVFITTRTFAERQISRRTLP